MLTPAALLARIRDEVPHPAGVRELVQMLKIPREERTSVRRLLRALVASGDLIQIRGHRYGLPDRMDLVVGRLTAHPSGYGFVAPERDGDGGPDLFIAPPYMADALHGDRVVARIERVKDDGRVEARIIRVLERSGTEVVGRYERGAKGTGTVIPWDTRLLMEVFIPEGEAGGAAPGDMVVVRLERWPTGARAAVGCVSRVLGDITAPGVDMEIVIRTHGLPDAHPPDVVAEAEALGTTVRLADLEGRTDFRTWQTVTIDGEHARDFDDAITIERLPNGHIWLGVHIADVAHYVPEGSALDRDAYERGTSVYFPERAIHMFPEALATGLCSLRPHVDRLVQSCLMEVDRQGQVVRAEFHDGVIHSDARMTYTDVAAILEAKDPALRERYAPLVPMFELMHACFTVLNDARRRRGSIDFDLAEAELIMDSGGAVEAIVALERNVAHRLIEEFMLLANETVASRLDGSGVPALYRIHEDPDLVKVAKFEEFIAGFRYTLGTALVSVQPRHFQQLIARIAGHPEEKPIATLMLRTMQKARYAPTNSGHFGLASRSYTHFTSPIRRYPDLVVHRALRAARLGAVSQDRLEQWADDMPEIGRHTSARERRADDAERELLQWKKVRFMADKVGDEFDAFITGVAAYGLFVELIEHYVEGLVHISTMADDYYRFVEAGHSLQGEATGRRYRLGDRITVQVLRVSLQSRQIDLGVVEILERVRQGARGARVSTREGSAPRGSKTKPSPSGTRRASRPGRRERVARKGTRR